MEWQKSEKKFKERGKALEKEGKSDDQKYKRTKQKKKKSYRKKKNCRLMIIVKIDQNTLAGMLREKYR